jgi:hypothetical protein
MALPGLNQSGLAFAPLTLPAPTYADLVASTLGNMGEQGDALDLSATALDALMMAFEADVTSTDATDTVPDVTTEILSTAVLDALLVEISVASATELAVGSALDFLAATFAVWGVFDDLVSWINVQIRNIVTYVSQAIFTASQNPFGLGPGTTGL